MHLNAVSIISFFGVIAVPIAFFVLVIRAWRMSQPGEAARRASLDKLKQLELSDVILFLKRLVAGAIIAALTILTAIGLFALIAFFPIITCHGEGSGGNCGEGLLASLPLALLTIPLDLVAAFFICKILAEGFWPER
jgi:hypothetical protein